MAGNERKLAGRVLDMTGCKCLGVIRDAGKSDRGKHGLESICGECRRPLKECGWLLHGKPFPGTKYWLVVAYYDRERDTLLYVVDDCPMHIKPEPQEQQTGQGV